MGVPKFYRWISERYPQINQVISDNTLLPDIDNFYLDMNGIIHACTHPNSDDLSNSLSIREMMLGIFRYIDRMVTEIVKPKKVLFMAIDGVAPRAKLNQQRSRRFRSAEERQLNLTKARQDGKVVDDTSIFDSNCITPGTDFMQLVGDHIRWFIRKKIKEDPLWRNLNIIFSGHDVPGEGEHKIMEFIRNERAKPDYDHNVRHCMYGQDADLIMLALTTHEPHFTLLREVINFNFRFGGNNNARQTVIRQTKEAQFQLLHISVLREYIEVDLGMQCAAKVDKERLIDDFIFLTFLVGNDFLPHLPTLDIGEQAFDVIFEAYKELLLKNPGYIVKDGEIGDLKRLEELFSIIGRQESDILKAREVSAKAFNSKRRKYKDATVMSEEDLEDLEEDRQRAFEEAMQEHLSGYSVSEVSTTKAPAASEVSTTSKDFKGRYYFEKFKVVMSSTGQGQMFLSKLMESYLEGLMWCLAYYVKGCISWTWYYPYHYGPMLQDMTNLSVIASRIHFNLGQPFKPFQQLLGCLPPASKNLLPKMYQVLMVGPDSPVIEFYPTEFSVDQDGKKNPWESVVLLPFIDEVRLKAAEAKFCNPSLLSPAEILRNSFGTISHISFNPNIVETYFSCNRDIGLPDILRCQSSATEEQFSISPGAFFKAETLSGTVSPMPGFPTLGVIPIQNITTDSFKINVFGSDSKYRNILIEFAETKIDLTSFDVKILIGRSVFVNYPLLHEARIVAVTTETAEYRAIADSSSGDVSVKKYSRDESTQWRLNSEAEALKYKKGRGLPGTGGLIIGKVEIRLRVCALQGMKQDPVTGARKKVFGVTEADIPIQLALWNPVCEDSRFQETEELPLYKRMPVGSQVVSLSGKFRGLSGTVIGPHSSDMEANKQMLKGKSSSKRRVLDVEFKVPPIAEKPFGYLIANGMADVYFPARTVCQTCNITPSLLGTIVGSLSVEPDGDDLGLNLKRNNQYQLLGYARRIMIGDNVALTTNAWTKGDTVKVIGAVDTSEDVSSPGDKEQSQWEYSNRTIALIQEYCNKFPQLFRSLKTLEYKKKYLPRELFGNERSTEKVQEVLEWMKSKPFFSMQRTSLSTNILPMEAMKEIESTADTIRKQIASTGGLKTWVEKGIPIETLFKGDSHSTYDAPLQYNNTPAKLGDRVVSLTAIGVPFGLKGTVIALHMSTGFVEVIFDEEFVGGKNLHGACSAFRGRLCPWSGLLRTSTDKEYDAVNSFRKSKPSYLQQQQHIPQSNKHIVVEEAVAKKPISIMSAHAKPFEVGSVPGSTQANEEPLRINIRRPPTAVTDSEPQSIVDVSSDDASASTSKASSDVIISDGTGKAALAEAAGHASILDVSSSIRSQQVIPVSYVGYIPEGFPPAMMSSSHSYKQQPLSTCTRSFSLMGSLQQTNEYNKHNPDRPRSISPRSKGKVTETKVKEIHKPQQGHVQPNKATKPSTTIAATTTTTPVGSSVRALSASKSGRDILLGVLHPNDQLKPQGVVSVVCSNDRTSITIASVTTATEVLTLNDTDNHSRKPGVNASIKEKLAYARSCLKIGGTIHDVPAVITTEQGSSAANLYTESLSVTESNDINGVNTASVVISTYSSVNEQNFIPGDDSKVEELIKSPKKSQGEKLLLQVLKSGTATGAEIQTPKQLVISDFPCSDVEPMVSSAIVEVTEVTTNLDVSGLSKPSASSSMMEKLVYAKNLHDLKKDIGTGSTSASIATSSESKHMPVASGPVPPAPVPGVQKTTHLIPSKILVNHRRNVK